MVGSVDRPVAGGIYREGLVGQPRSLNPLLDPSDPVTRDVARLVFAGLTRVTDGGDIQGDLAERWTTEDEGRSYTFYLRSGARWHDGQPVVAADVIATVALVRSPAFAGPAVLQRVWGEVQAEEVDARTVRLRLARPYSSFIEACSMPILPSHLFGLEDGLREHAASYQPVGAGPFRVAEHTSGMLRLARHGGYQGPKPYFDEVHLVYFPDPGAAIAALRDRRLDGFAGAPAGTAPAPTDPGSTSGQIVSWPLPLLGEQLILYFNHRNSVLADSRVRKAFAAMIDRPRLFIEVAGMSAVPAHGPIPAFSWAYAPWMDVPADPTSARSLLDAAGWMGLPTRTQNGRPLRLQLAVPLEGRLVGLAEAIKAQLQALGAEIELQPTEQLDLYRERLATRRFDMALLHVGLGNIDPDPGWLWESAQAESGFNFAGYRRAAADELIVAARLDGDPGRRRRALEGFQQLWLEDAPSVVLGSPVMTYAIWDHIRGVRPGTVPEPGARLQHLAEWYIHTERIPALLSLGG